MHIGQATIALSCADECRFWMRGLRSKRLERPHNGPFLPLVVKWPTVLSLEGFCLPTYGVLSSMKFLLRVRLGTVLQAFQ